MKKNIIITGCSSGFGYGTALLFAKKGWHVYAGVRTLQSEGVTKLQKIAEKEKYTLIVVPLDVTNDNQITDFKKMLEKNNESIDVLVNNAGFGYLGPIEEFSLEEINEEYNTNIFGAIRMVKVIAPLMRKQHSGTIINISSINGLISFPLFGIYSSSKFALETISESLRFELSHFGIRVILIEPGSFLSRFALNRKHPQAMGEKNSPYAKLTQTFFDRYQKTHDKAVNNFVSRFAQPEKVAQLIYKIANNHSSRFRYIVGIDARLFYILHQILPQFLWEFILKKTYDW